MLEQKFHSQTPNAVWLADTTYIDTDEGWLYLAGVKDMATREIVGWAMEDHMHVSFAAPPSRWLWDAEARFRD